MFSIERENVEYGDTEMRRHTRLLNVYIFNTAVLMPPYTFANLR